MRVILADFFLKKKLYSFAKKRVTVLLQIKFSTLIIAALDHLELPQFLQLINGTMSKLTVRLEQFSHLKKRFIASITLIGCPSALHKSEAENHLYLH